MREVAFAAAVLLLPVAAGCGDRQRNDVSSTMDTAVAPAPEPAPSAGQETARGLDTRRDYGFEEREDFAQSIRRQLAELDQRIEELSAQAKSAGGAVSDRALERIRATRRAVDRSLQRVGAATADRWEEIRGGVNQAMDDLDEAVERAYPK